MFTQPQSEGSYWCFAGNQEPVIERNKISFEAVAVVGIIDAYGNIIALETRQKSYDKESFIDFLKTFRKKTAGRCVLVMDNLSFHRSQDVKNYCFKHRITLVYNGI